MSKNKEVFWTVLPRFMTIAGLNQTELAKAVGVSKSTVTCWIKRKSFPEMPGPQSDPDNPPIREDTPTGCATVAFQVHSITPKMKKTGSR